LIRNDISTTVTFLTRRGTVKFPVPVNETRPESVPAVVLDLHHNRRNPLRHKGLLGSGGGT